MTLMISYPMMMKKMKYKEIMKNKSLDEFNDDEEGDEE